MAYYRFVGYLFSLEWRETMKSLNGTTGTCNTEMTNNETFADYVEELKETAKTMCELGMKLELKNPKLRLRKSIVKSDENPHFDEIFEFVGEKHGITSEQVKDYINIYTNSLFWGEQGAVKLEFMKIWFNRTPSLEEVIVFMFISLKNYLMTTSNKAWL